MPLRLTRAETKKTWEFLVPSYTKKSTKILTVPFARLAFTSLVFTPMWRCLWFVYKLNTRAKPIGVYSVGVYINGALYPGDANIEGVYPLMINISIGVYPVNTCIYGGFLFEE